MGIAAPNLALPIATHSGRLLPRRPSRMNPSRFHRAGRAIADFGSLARPQIHPAL